MSYQIDIKEHLEKYKFGNSELKEKEKGFWARHQKFYHHILPDTEANRKLNLLPEYRNTIWDYKIQKDVELHQYFHHLNSSQAMCLNFFYPLWKENELITILKLIKLEDESIESDSICFEKESNIEEKPFRPTSFDFYFKTESGKNIYFEIKYTEQKFGTAKPDEEHKLKFEDVYKKHLKALEKEYHNPNKFFDNYQLLRNLIHLSEDGNSRVIFIYPKGNKKIQEQAKNAKSMVIDSLKDYVISLTWEELLESVETETKNKKIKEQLKEFRKKYNITTP